jgi:hypothetical protein
MTRELKNQIWIYFIFNIMDSDRASLKLCLMHSDKANLNLSLIGNVLRIHNTDIKVIQKTCKKISEYDSQA